MIKDILTRARQRITPPEAWTKGCFARNSLGHAVEPEDRSAVSWCAVGALYAEAPLGQFSASRAAFERAVGGAPAPFNDRSTQQEVLNAFDRAIEACK